MKKLFIAASLIIGMIAGAMVLSSFTILKQDAKTECTQLIVANRPIWEGRAYDQNNCSWLSIKVYPVENQCNSYYAVIQKAGAFSCTVGDEVWIVDNPDYDPDRRDSSYLSKRYRMSYRNKYFYFNM